MLQQSKQVFIYSIIVLCFIFLFMGKGITQNVILKEIWNLGHFLLFLFIAFPASLRIALNKITIFKRLTLTVLVTVILASIIEVIQHYLNRSVSIEDVLLSSIGAATSVFLFTEIKKTIKWPAIIICCSLALTPLYISIFELIKSKVEQPIYLAISKKDTPSYLSGRAEKSFDDVNKIIKVTFKPDIYSGIRLRNIKNDWSKYSLLKINITNTDKRPFLLRCLVYDNEHIKNNRYDYEDRFYIRRSINIGENTIHIPIARIERAPKNRKMNIRDIYGLECYTYYLSKTYQAEITNISLE